MKVRQLDSNHDWTFGQGLSGYLDKSAAVSQCVKTRLLSFKNNWELDLDHGVDWWAHFSKNPDVRYIESDLRKNILAVQGVASISDLQLLLDTVTRKMTVVVRYTDIYGSTETVEQIVRD